MQGFNMKARLCGIALAFALALGIWGCGGGDAKPDLPDVQDAGIDLPVEDPGTPVDSGNPDAGRDPGETPDDVAVDVSEDDGASPEVAEDIPDVPPPPLWDGLAPAGGGTLGSIVGVASHMSVAAGEDVERAFELASYQEFSNFRIRRGMRWNNVEPAQDDWRWDRVSGGPADAYAAGIRFMPMLAYGNKWAQEDPEIYGTLNIADYADYAGHMAAMFCEQAKDYELWNEQDTERFWHMTPDPEKYADMLIASSAAIRQACPDARVVFGGITSYGELDMWDRWLFLRLALAARPQLCTAMDAVALHPYTWFQYDSPEHDEVLTEFATRDSQSAMTQIARAILEDAGCGDTPLLFTELGWPTYDLTEEQVARFAVRSLLLAARDGVEGWYWYTFWDDRPEDDAFRPHENHFGLWHWPGEDGSRRDAKPAWFALKGADQVLGHHRFARDLGAALGLPNDVYVLAFVDEAGGIALALWDGREMPDVWLDGVDEGGPDTTFDLVLPLPDCAVGTRLVDMVGAELDPPAGDATVALTLTPEVQYLVIDCGTPRDR
jgi:hypothetical protein